MHRKKNKMNGTSALIAVVAAGVLLLTSGCNPPLSFSQISGLSQLSYYPSVSSRCTKKNLRSHKKSYLLKVFSGRGVGKVIIQTSPNHP